MEALQASLTKINIANAGSSIYKDECAFSFATQESEGGLLIDMNSFVSFSPKYALLNFRRTGHAIYLNIFKKRVPKKQRSHSTDETGAPKVLGIGVKGGFFDRESNYEFETTTALVILPDYTRIDLPNVDIPTKVQLSIDAIMEAQSASLRAGVAPFSLNDDFGESKYARNLQQLDNGVKISNQGWKCAKCDKTNNLWLNLSDGAILCGRKVHGSALSGNGHALEHYNETGYPLVVKLGTITPDGTADVYSYAADENDSVLDPLLETHLLHWGIDLKEMKKTEKTVAELEAELQHSFEWSSILESDIELLPLYGPGYTGIHNLGNTCYMASVMQVLFSIPEWIQRYHENAQHFFETPKKDLIPQDFHCQLAKFARGVLSGDYSKPPSPEEIAQSERAKAKLIADAEASKAGLPISDPDPYDFPIFVERGVRPLMFKSLVGHGHPEFATNRQQDSLDFYRYFLDLVQRNEHARGDKDESGNVVPDPSNVFRFGMETRLQCSISNTVGYDTHTTSSLLLPLPNKILNKEEYDEYLALKEAAESISKEAANDLKQVYPVYDIHDCFESLFSPEVVDDWLSPAAGVKTIAYKTAKFATFPEYLTLQIGKFRYDAGWIPKKIQIKLNVPDRIDLTQYKSQGGLQADEIAFPKVDNASASAPVQKLWDDEVVNTLTSMDIPLIRAQRASHFTLGRGIDAAMEWVFSHSEDADIDTPLPQPSATPVKSAASALPEPDAVLIESITEMGFTPAQAKKALRNTDNNAGRAIDWLFSHPDDTGVEDDAPTETSNNNVVSPSQSLIDGNGKYELFAFVSHMGTSTMSGHYVCHIKKNGNWVSINDEKVAESRNPPREMGYLYFFKRIH